MPRANDHRRAPTGKIRQLREFFEANPNEELSAADIAAKFGCAVTTARNAIVYLRAEGLLERVSVYRLKSSV